MMFSIRTATTPTLLLALCFGLLAACGDSDEETPAQDTGADLGQDAGGDADEEVTPDADLEVTPDADLEVTPDADLEVTPDAVEEVTPDADEEVTPDVVEEVTPDVIEDTDVIEEPWPLDEIEIAGLFVDNFGGTHVITSTTWSQGLGAGASLFTFEGVWNDEGFAVAENAETNAFSAGLYSRFDWFQDGDDLWFCQTAYDAATAALAFETAAADSTNLGSGCGGFGWSQLLDLPLDDIEIAGEYVDNFGGAHLVTNTMWTQGEGETASTFTFTAVVNADRVAIAQNGASNMFSPGLYSRFDWHVADGLVWYCQTAYAAETEAAAWTTPAADVTDLAAGCGGFSWSELLVPEGVTE